MTSVLPVVSPGILPTPRTPLVGRATELAAARGSLARRGCPAADPDRSRRCRQDAPGPRPSPTRSPPPSPTVRSSSTSSPFATPRSSRPRSRMRSASAKLATVRWPDAAHRIPPPPPTPPPHRQLRAGARRRCRFWPTCSRLARRSRSSPPAARRCASGAKHLLPGPPLALPARTAEDSRRRLGSRLTAVALFVQRAWAADPGFALTAQTPSPIAECLPPPRRSTPGDRAGGRPAAVLSPAGPAGAPVDRSSARPDRRRARRPGPPAHAARRDRLEPRPVVLRPSGRSSAGSPYSSAASGWTPPRQSPASPRRSASIRLDGVEALRRSRSTPRLPQATEDLTGEPIRFAMLETIRAFALERLRESGEEEHVRRCSRGAHSWCWPSGRMWRSETAVAWWFKRLEPSGPSTRTRGRRAWAWMQATRPRRCGWHRAGTAVVGSGSGSEGRAGPASWSADDGVAAEIRVKGLPWRAVAWIRATTSGHVTTSGAGRWRGRGGGDRLVGNEPLALLDGWAGVIRRGDPRVRGSRSDGTRARPPGKVCRVAALRLGRLADRDDATRRSRSRRSA